MTEQKPTAPNSKGSLIKLALVVAALLGVFWLTRQSTSSPAAVENNALSYSKLYELATEGEVASVHIEGQKVTGELASKSQIGGRSIKRFQSAIPDGDDALLSELRNQGTDITIEPPTDAMGWQMLIGLLPWVLIIGVWVWLARRARQQMGGMTGTPGPLGSAMRGHVRKIERDKDVKTRFADVAGLTYAKRDVEEIVDFMRAPERFRVVGGEVPRGLLLVGPPGTGKTLLARAVAGEAGVPFFSVSGSEFIELFVGMGASRVRQLFKEAKQAAPAIVFVDERDAVGRSRGAGFGGGHDEREQTLNQLLSEMDGFESHEMVVVLAATNRPDVLDPALQRPGRFDRRVMVERPEAKARKDILEVHCRGKPLADDVSLESLARQTAGFSGADLKALVNEAALHAARSESDRLSPPDFDAALDKVVLGNPREGKLHEVEKRRIAVHEAGHALIAHKSAKTEPLKRVSILPRGIALGATQEEPAEDKHIHTQGELTDRLRVLMGGYAAEKMVFGDLSSGAEDDLKKAGNIAFKMVAHFGMSEAIGPLYHEHRSEHPFLGHRAATNGGTSDATVRAIEEECRLLATHAFNSAAALLEKHRARFDALVDCLLEKETLEKKELGELLGEADTTSAAWEPAAAQ